MRKHIVKSYAYGARLRPLLIVGTVGLVLLGGCSDPDSRAAKYVKQGQDLMAQQQYDKAKLEFRNALKIKPTLAEPYFQLGLIDEAAGDLRSAFEDYSRAEQQDPHHHGALVKLAGFYFGAGRFDDAQSRIDIVLKAWPDDAAAHALNAAIMLRKNDTDGANKEVAAALKIDPGNIPAISVQVGIDSALNDLDKAAAVLEEGIKLNPNDTSLLILKVQLFKKNNLPDKVAEAYQQIFKLHPVDRVYRAQGAAYFADEGDLDRAEQILRDGITAMPSDQEMKRLLVSFLDLKRGMDPAVQEVQKLIKAEPDNSSYLFWLTDLYVRHKNVDKAVSMLNEIVAQNASEDAVMAARTGLARISYGRGDRDGASKQLTLVLAKQPNNQDALFVKSAINFDLGNYQVVVTDLRSLLRDHPKSPEALQLLSEALVKVGHVDLAAETLAQLLDVQPDNHPAQARLAQLYHMSGDEKRADVLLQTVTTQAPDYSIGWESQARIALDRKDWTLADSAIDHLEKIPEQVLTADYLRGVWLLGQSKPQDAVAKFSDVLTKDANSPQAALALPALVNTSRQLGQLQTAVTFIEGLNSDSGDVHTTLGNCYIELNKPEEAAKEYDLAIAKSPTQADPFIGRAKLYLAAGQFDEAEGVLKKGAAAVPSDFRAPLLLGDLAMRDKRYAEATAIYADILARNPDMQVAANNYAELVADYQYTDSAALEKARQVADRFQASDSPALLDTVAWVYYRLGQYQDASSFMQRVMTSKTITPQMHYHYGALLLKQGDKDKAREELKKATVDGVSYPGIEDAKAMLSQL
jgi:tetratricopeptide (TPR) repeat protein